MRHTIRTIFVLAIDSLLFVGGLLTIPALSDRATLPVNILADNGRLVVSKVSLQTSPLPIAVGDQILSCDGISVQSPDALEFLCDTKAIGSTGSVEIVRDGGGRHVAVELVPFYPTPRLVLVLVFLGIILFGLSIFLRVRLVDNFLASTFHWVVVLLMATFLFSQGHIDPTDWISVARRMLLLAVYPMCGAALFFFALNFPKPLEGTQRLLAFLVFPPMVGIAGFLCTSFLSALARSDEPSVARFLFQYRFFQAAFFAFVMLSVARLLYAYLRAGSKESRTKLQWVLWGLGIGPIPFLFLVLLPDVILGFDLIPEEIALVALVVPPFAMTIAIVRHNVFDIEVLVNRSLVYALFTGVVGSVYILLLLLLTSTFAVEQAQQTGGAVLITAAFALALNPLRVRLQGFVDEQLFPAKVKFRSRLSSVLDALRRTASDGMLFQRLETELAAVFNQHTVLCLRSNHAGSYTVQFPESRSDEVVSLERAAAEECILNNRALERSIGVLRRTRTTQVHRWMDTHGFDACVPIVSESNQLLALLALSCKGPSSPLASEEILLLESCARETSEMLARFSLQAEYFNERERRLRVETVNKTASDFISTVSHELQTPLTSVSMFAELLRSRRRSSTHQRTEFLTIIEGESRRLSRLINSLLDFSRVERGVREYQFQSTDFSAVVRRALDAMKYSFDKEKASVSVRIPKSTPMASADPDALEEMLINLLSNALKYSPGVKAVRLRVVREKNVITCEVSDRGTGIPKDALKKIFDRHYRASTPEHKQVGGLGIGLSLVQHTVVAHGGHIRVQSVLGKGSTFTISLPALTKGRGRA